MEDITGSKGARKSCSRLGANSNQTDDREGVNLLTESVRPYPSQRSGQRCHREPEYSLGDSAIGNFSSISDYHALSCSRSVGSVGSHGSGDRSFSATNHRNHHPHHPFHRQFPAAYLMNGETRFPTASSYAASEAGKSDVATVCSGSVIEDIEVSSVISGGDNSQSWGAASNAHPSPPSSVKVAPAVASGGSARRVLQGRGVEFAASLQHELMLSTVVPHSNINIHHRSLPNRWNASENEVALASNNMGPPLSRALLLQHRQFGSFSRAESVKSFGSNAGSDVIAHVDTDDCGGSLIESVTDGHSIHSQEDNRMGNDNEDGAVAAMPVQELNEGDPLLPHPWLRDGDDDGNGRVSPGGTIYKGRGVRRYQGRYMHLPLKRFHQDAMAMNRADDELPIRHEYEGVFDSGDHWDEAEKIRTRSESPPDRRDFHARKRSWSRSRSRSRSPTQSRIRSPKLSRSDRQDVAQRKRSKSGESTSRYRVHRKGGSVRPYSRSGSKSNRDEQGSSQSPLRNKHRRK